MLLQVNEVDFQNMSNDDAVRVLREMVHKPGPITLTVAKCWDPSPQGYFTLPQSMLFFSSIAGKVSCTRVQYEPRFINKSRSLFSLNRRTCTSYQHGGLGSTVSCNARYILLPVLICSMNFLRPN